MVMITLSRVKDNFVMELPSTNGKTLFKTVPFTQKHSCWKNVTAMMKFFGSKQITLRDISSKKPEEHVVWNIKLVAGKLQFKDSGIKP